jgi:hypothetical protein
VVREYFYSGRFRSRAFNNLQEKPIELFIKDYIEFEEVRYAFKKKQEITPHCYRWMRSSVNDVKVTRTYCLSFLFERQYWDNTNEMKYEFNQRLPCLEDFNTMLLLSEESLNTLFIEKVTPRYWKPIEEFIIERIIELSNILHKDYVDCTVPVISITPETTENFYQETSMNDID